MIRAKPLLGTMIEITIDAPLPQLNVLFECAFSCIEHIQNMMSFHQQNSDLNQLHQFAHQMPVQVHPYLYYVLTRAQRFFKHSMGIFDCTIAPTLIKNKLLPKHSLLTPHTSATYDDVVLLGDFFVFFKQPLLLDLGGIAKGFAVDLAIHTLKKLGVQSATVNARGDIRVLGKKSHYIHVRHPQNPSHFLPLGHLTNGAVATSACYYQNSLVVPKTHTSIRSKQSYSIIAPTACTADALTKVLAITRQTKHACFTHFGAQGIIIP